MNRQQGQSTQIVLPTTSSAISTVFNGFRNFGRRHPVYSGGYLLGLLIALTCSGLALTSQQLYTYNTLLSQIDTDQEYSQSLKYHEANNAYLATKGWFWTCDDTCTRNKKRMEKQKYALDGIRERGNQQLSNAKASAGIFSTLGVDEARGNFWSYFAQGTKFAKRQTMWDALFTGFRSMSRNESTSEYLMKMVMTALMNFTLGLVICLVVFTGSLYSLIMSYQPTILEGVLFFVVAFLAASATVVTVVGGMFGTVGVAGFAVAKMVEGQQRIEGGRGGRGQHLHQQ